MKALASYPNPLLHKWRLPAGVTRPSLWYRLWRDIILPPTFCGMWKVRAFNRHYEPASGGVVYISNHQSFLDPMLVGFALSRPCNYMARESLFRFPGFKQLIESVYAFPVRRGTADLRALKEAMRRLKQGGQLAVFAEGTRTRDGRIGPLQPGVAMMAQRAAEWTVPVVIDGAFEAWPRWQPLPSAGNIVVQFGPAISQARARQLSAGEFVAQVRRAMVAIQHEIRQRIGREPFSYE